MRIDVGISKKVLLYKPHATEKSPLAMPFLKVWQCLKNQITYESEFLGDLMWWDVSAGHDDIRDVGVIQA